MKSNQFLAFKGIRLLLDHIMEIIFEGKVEITYRELLKNVNMREIGLTFLGKFGKEQAAIFINLHQIKGLEFDAVFYFPMYPPARHPDEDLQQLNLNYVARSRAKYYLYIVQ